MARISGIDLPRGKRTEIALTAIFGIGHHTAGLICQKANVDPASPADNLTDSELARIRDVIQREFRVEGELRKELSMNIKRLIDLQTYRGLRHRRRLPVRGQRTHTNARTRKGPRRGVTKRKAPPR